MEWTQQSDRQNNRAIAHGQEQNERLPTRLLLILEAYMSLIRFDFYLARGNFEAIYKKVRNYPVRNNFASPDAVERICTAVDMACIWYCKEVLCLQRSAVTTCLLRKHGVPGRLVIGAQQMPFKAHAWAEVDGRVVNDKQYVHELYARLDQC
jgi:Transglutaminase-like superfamily